jgi:hypothetical protein
VLKSLLILLFATGWHTQYSDDLIKKIDPRDVADVPVFVSNCFFSLTATV